MFERFTDRARRVLVFAQEEARLLNHNFLGTEHILLGLIREGEGVGAKALTELGVSLHEVREMVVATIGPAAEPTVAAGAPPFTPRAKKVLELSLREALQLGHNYIGTEHLLLALIREGEGVAAQVLASSGLAVETVRQKVIGLLSGYGSVPAGRRRQSPAATSVIATAVSDPFGAVVGTHDFLLATLAQEQSLGAKVLASLGVTADAVRARITEIGVAGTTDEPPRSNEERSTSLLRVDLGGGVVVEVNDPAIAAELADVIGGPEEGRADRLKSALAEHLTARATPGAEEPDEPTAESGS